MYSNEFLNAMKADREREIKAAHRAHLLDRSKLDEELERAAHATDRVTARLVRHSVQPGSATPGSSR